MQPPSSCYTCHVIHKKDSLAEVWYDKVKRWVCLECHLTEKTLQKVKGRGTVSNIVHKCSSCGRGPPSEPESTPCWFCYDCSQFLCQECLVTEHMDEAACVRIDYTSQFGISVSSDLMFKNFKNDIKNLMRTKIILNSAHKQE